MSLQTYDKVNAPPSRKWPVYHINADQSVDQETDWFKPGDWVTHTWGKGEVNGRGIVVAITGDQIVVLWSEEPQNPSDFSKFAFPIVRKVYPQQLAQQIVSVQPMTLPSGLIFYQDFKYGEEEPKEDQKRKKKGRRRPTGGPRKNPGPANGV